MPCRTMWWLILWILTLLIGSVARRWPPSCSPGWYKYLKAASGQIGFPAGRFCFNGGFFSSLNLWLWSLPVIFWPILGCVCADFPVPLHTDNQRVFQPVSCWISQPKSGLCGSLFLPRLILTLCSAISCITEPMNSLPGSTCRSFG